MVRLVKQEVSAIRF